MHDMQCAVCEFVRCDEGQHHNHKGTYGDQTTSQILWVPNRLVSIWFCAMLVQGVTVDVYSLLLFTLHICSNPSQAEYYLLNAMPLPYIILPLRIQ